MPGGPLAVFGSSALTVSLLEHGLIDELRVMVSPTLLGAGPSLFTGLAGRVRLELLRTTTYRSGNVLLCYRPSAVEPLDPGGNGGVSDARSGGRRAGLPAFLNSQYGNAEDPSVPRVSSGFRHPADAAGRLTCTAARPTRSSCTRRSRDGVVRG